MMRLVDSPTLAGAACVCGNASNGPFLDTGMQDPYNGRRVYLCNLHFTEALRAEKLVTLAELEEVVRRLGAANAEIAQFEEKERQDFSGVRALKERIDNDTSTIAGLRADNVHLARRVAELTVPPAAVERRKMIASLPVTGAGPKRRTRRAA